MVVVIGRSANHGTYLARFVDVEGRVRGGEDGVGCADLKGECQLVIGVTSERWGRQTYDWADLS